MGQNSLERTIHIFYMRFQKIGSGPTFIMIQNCDMKTSKGKKNTSLESSQNTKTFDKSWQT